MTAEGFLDALDAIICEMPDEDECGDYISHAARAETVFRSALIHLAVEGLPDKAMRGALAYARERALRTP